MQWKLNELRGKLADQGKSTALEAIAEATGISRQTLTEISKGRLRVPRPEYIDALSAYFARELGIGIDEIQLVRAEPVSLPLDLNIRPDRRGARVGQRTRRASSHATQRRGQSPSDFTALASEEALAREWDTPEEDKAWADL